MLCGEERPFFTRSDALTGARARVKVLLSSSSRKSNDSHFLTVILLKHSYHSSPQHSLLTSLQRGVPCLRRRLRRRFQISPRALQLCFTSTVLQMDVRQTEGSWLPVASL